MWFSFLVTKSYILFEQKKKEMLSENFQRKISTYTDFLLVIRLNRYKAAPLLTYYTRDNITSKSK
jgi:hypothetical protein